MLDGLRNLCLDKSSCDLIVQPKRRAIDWWEVIQFTGRSVWKNSKERKRKSVGLRHSGRCHGSSHGVSHTHTVSSLCMLFRPTQSHTLQCHSHSLSNQTAQAIGKHTAILDCLKIELFFYTGCFLNLFDEMMSKQLLQYAGAQIKNICTSVSSRPWIWLVEQHSKSDLSLFLSWTVWVLAVGIFSDFSYWWQVLTSDCLYEWDIKKFI